jgi:EmrB/QacA subfamily drug resistance transporter
MPATAVAEDAAHAGADPRTGPGEEGITVKADKRWLALPVICVGEMMIILDAVVIGVALPWIRRDIGFSDESLVWVLNAYLLTSGGFLLLAGRLGDLYGHRRMFLTGVGIFTLASVACGVATSEAVLIAARAVQGVGGAVISAVGLSLVMTMFVDPAERTKAMGVFGLVVAGGGAIGVLLAGILTDAFNWRWIFYINVPVGAALFVLSLWLLPRSGRPAERIRLDVAGAVTATSSLTLAAYAFANASGWGWTSTRTLAVLAGAVALIVLFGLIETRVRDPLVPLSVLRRRNIAVSNIVAGTWAAGQYAWFFFSALYLQVVLGYSALQVGLAFFLPRAIMALVSVGLSARLVIRFGVRPPLATGLGLIALGLVLLSRAPVDGSFVADVLPGMVFVGLGTGMAYNPVFVSAMSDAEASEAGLASGIVNTSFTLGGALGLAALVSLATSRTNELLSSGSEQLPALAGGYHTGLLVGALCAAAAATMAAVLLRFGPVSAEAPETDPRPETV